MCQDVTSSNKANQGGDEKFERKIQKNWEKSTTIQKFKFRRITRPKMCQDVTTSNGGNQAGDEKIRNIKC